MKFSTKGRYALRLMVDLAQQDPGVNIALRDISARQEISVKYLEQIVAPLSRAGLLKSIRGAQGGYRLARPAKNYTAGEILRVIEGSLAPIACLEDEINQCARCTQCPTIGFWEGLDRVIQEYVDGVTLEQLAAPHCQSEEAE